MLDGTSCSSSVIAGLISSVNRYQLSRGKPKLGFINPLLYSIYNEHPDVFHDILKGNSTCTQNLVVVKNLGLLLVPDGILHLV